MGSIAYVELGDNNGGIVLNVSEGGLSLTAMGVLDVGHPQRIRVQPPRSRDWIELAGEFAWVSESKKAAGIRFHELTGEAGSRIRNWISLEALAAPVPTVRETVPEKYEPLGRATVTHEPGRQTLGPGAPDGPARMPAQPGVPPAIPPLTWLKAKVPPAAPAQLAQPPKPTDEIGQRPHAEGLTRWMISESALRDLRIIAAPVAIAALLSFVGGWFAARERMVTKTTQAAGVTAETTSESTRAVDPPSTSRDAPRSGPAGQNAQTMAKRTAIVPAIVADAGGEGALPPTASSVSNALSGAAEKVRSASHPPEPPAPSSIPAGPGAAATVPTKQKESATASRKPPETTAIPEGSVSISYPDFPSMRVPPELRSQSRLGTRFQIGQLVSRVEPAYPEEIRTRRIEGTVKVHAVIGRDGTVQSVALLSGPPLLAPLAMQAIQAWHFEQTLLGGQSIETEEDITVVFRLTSPGAQSN